MILKKYCTISLLIIILSIGFKFTISIDKLNTNTIDSTPLNDNKYQFHEPIVITSEEDLILQGWPGSGTENSPYLIEGLNITSPTTCISIFNIQVYLVVKNCILNVTHHLVSGSIIRDSKYVQFTNCIIESKTMGLEIIESEDCIASNNTIIGCPWGGLVVSFSHNCGFMNNSMFECGFFITGISENEWAHVFLENKVNDKQLGYFLHTNNSVIDGEKYGQLILVACENIQVDNGEFSQATIGIQISYSKEILISNVVIRENSYSGVWILYSHNISLSEIEAHGSGFTGIESYESQILVSNSIIRGNMQGGILCFKGIIEITDNRIFSNRGYGGIYISNASGECIIKSNMVYLNQMLGISLIDVVECLVLDNYVEGHRNTGIYTTRAETCICVNNTLVNNVEGLYIREIEDCLIRGNRISGSDDFGLHLFSISDAEVSNNTLFRNWNYGFYFNQIYYTNICFNHIYENGGNGIYIYNSTLCFVYSNDVHNNDFNGFSLEFSEYFQVQNNTFYRNDVHGMQLSNSDINHISDNMFYENRGYGLAISSGDANLILNNTFFSNMEGNARDDGSHNIWHYSSDTTQLGNWWDDWNGTGFYAIEGDAGSLDRLPSLFIVSTTPSNMTTQIVEFNFSTRIIIALFFVIVGVLGMTFWYRERK